MDYGTKCECEGKGRIWLQALDEHAGCVRHVRYGHSMVGTAPQRA